MQPTYLVTGGAGFIGSWFVTHIRKNDTANVITLDALTYAGNLDNLASLDQDPGHTFIHGAIEDATLVGNLLRDYNITAVVHFAAESHVDRSIHDPDAFVRTNVLGTVTLLRESLAYWQNLQGEAKTAFRFLHVSTDEVFGSLDSDDPPFTETSPYDPKSPYSASKAASDHFVRAFHATYGMPVIITNCSNNYGPRQFPEKLIPLMILNALEGKSLPVYGSGENVRDWLHVADHCTALAMCLEKGLPGETYVVGGKAEKRNIDLVHAICGILDDLAPSSRGPHAKGITFVTDRPGHDLRYAINPAKIEHELGWSPDHSFESGLRETVQWYLDNLDWVRRIQNGSYREWIQQNYIER